MDIATNLRKYAQHPVRYIETLKMKRNLQLLSGTYALS